MITFDIEANGFLPQVTQVWVLSYKVDDEPVKSIRFPHKKDLLSLFGRDAIFVGHNIIDYDLPVLEKLYGIELDIRVLDTYVLAQLINPDRPGGNGLDALSGGGKTDFSDFSKWSQEMETYCENDVVINAKVCKELLQCNTARANDSAGDVETTAERCSIRYTTGGITQACMD